MRDWILVLLDPSPIGKGTQDPSKGIESPPRFEAPPSEPEQQSEAESEAEQEPAKSATNGAASPPAATEAKSTRKRALRSASPTKSLPPTAQSTPGRKIATPRRAKRGRPTTSSLLASTTEENDASAEPEPESTNTDTIKVDIETTTEPNADGEEQTSTHVTVETPANHPDLDLPADARAYLDQAKRALSEANKLTASRATGRKRKAREMEIEDAALQTLLGDADGDGDAETEGAAHAAVARIVGADEQDVDVRPVKRLRQTEMELRKERIKARALTGVAASLAIG